MIDVTDASFERDVLERSDQVPVVVDLWAEWCGPCRTLGPILERVVGETDGAVELTKVNVDENPRIGATFRVQSIPAVFALRDRQVVDSFIGAQPEAAVREFVSRLAPAASEADLLVEAGDEASLRRALELEPDHPGAVVALAELLVAQGQAEEALTLLGRIPETAEVRRVAALARLGNGALKGDTDLEGRLDGLLDRVKQDDQARREFLDLLEAMGPGDPRTVEYRKALTARLF
ncbi:MAG TPA: tetratricopeptide repeat protein [Acidimicrobiales bacterium]